MTLSMDKVKELARLYVTSATGMHIHRTDSEITGYLCGLSDAFDLLGMPHERLEACDAAESVFYHENADNIPV